MSVTKYNKDADAIEDAYAPMLFIKTQQQADEFLRDYTAGYAENHPDVALWPYKYAKLLISFTLQTVAEAFILDEEQKKLIYELFKFDPAWKQSCIEAKDFIGQEMLKQMSGKQ